MTTGAAGESLPLHRYVLRLGDLALVLGQRLSEWVGHSPALEEDLGLANIALDLIGQARLLLALAAEIEGRGRSEDDIAFLRDQGECLNPTLVEQPNGDFGETIVREALIDAFQLALYERLSGSSDARLAAISAKALKETRYHLRYSSGWLVRLGDGTPESHQRVQKALERLWPFTVELFEEDALDLNGRAGHRAAARRGEGSVEPPHRCHARRGGHARSPGRPALYLVRQARRAQRAPRLSAHRDAVPPTALIRDPLVMGRQGLPRTRHAMAAGSRALAVVPDPELPALTIADLGLVRFIRRSTEIGVLSCGPFTDLYAGCAASDHIRASPAEQALRDRRRWALSR